MTSILSSMRFVNSLPPVANAFAGTVYPISVNMATVGRLAFLVVKGVGTTGTTTITVLAGSDKSPTLSVAVPFRYKRVAADNVTVQNAPTQATSAGFTTTAGSSDLYVIEIDTKDLASSGYSYAHILMVESVASPVVGCVVALATDMRFADSTTDIID